MEDIINDSLSKIKNSVTEALKEENLKLQQKAGSLVNRISELETDSNKQDQYNRRNDLEIHGIPHVFNDKLRKK